MGTLTSWTTATNLLKSIEQCDIVEFNRITYLHYGIYIGNGICVHVQAPSGSSVGSFSRSSASSSMTSGNRGSSLGTKVAEPLISIAGGDCVRVNNAEFTAFQLGVKPRPKTKAIQLAIEDLPVDKDGNVILGRSINVKYFLVSSNNCEGWSTYWKYDHPYGWSIQATNCVINSTIGTVERFSDTMIFCAENILSDENAPFYKKATVGAALVPYTVAKVSASCAKNAANVALGGLMRMFR